MAFAFHGTLAELYLVDMEGSAGTWENADEAILFGGPLRKRADIDDQMEDLFQASVDAAYIFYEAPSFADIQAVARAPTAAWVKPNCSDATGKERSQSAAFFTNDIRKPRIASDAAGMSEDGSGLDPVI